MQVTVESTNTLERRVRVQIPEERVTGEVDKRLDDLARSASLPGFRPGKAPVKILRQRFGPRVRDEVVGDLVRSSLDDALANEQLQPATRPTVDPLRSQPGEGVDFTVTFDVYPEVALRPLDTIEIRRPRAEVDESDIDRMVETLRRQRRQWETSEREARTGDRAVIDYRGSVEGRELPHGQGEEVPVEIGLGRMIPGFEDGLVGVQAGEEKTLHLTFPDEYEDDEVAGKAVEFAVKVHRIEEATLPELDEDFVAGFGVREGGVETFRAELRGNMERELDDGLRSLLKQRVLEALLEGQEFELPSGLVDEEVRRAMERQRAEFRHSGMEPDRLQLEASMFEEAARRRVTLGLLIAETVKVHDIRVDPDRVRQRIETIASTYEDEAEVVNYYYSDPQRLSYIESTVLEDQVIDWILERANVSEESMSFDQVLSPGQTSEAPSP
jgi:trigger factor